MSFWRRIAAIGALLSVSTTAYGQHNDQGSNAVDKIVVVGADQGRYRIEDSGALTGFQLDFLELPWVVNVIPEQLILEQKVTDLGEALRNMSQHHPVGWLRRRQ